MTRNLCWTTIAVALLALTAGAAWAEEPQKQPPNTSPKCCDEKGCCSEYRITQSQACPTTTVQAAPSCPQCANSGSCCSRMGSNHHQTKTGCAKCATGVSCDAPDGCEAGSCCADGGKGACCAKHGKASCCAGCAEGCTCCGGSAASSRTGQKKKVIVYVIEAPPPMPFPLPPPAVCMPHPVPPGGPVTVVETPDGVRHICGGMSCPAAPAYPCPVPAPMMAEHVPPPAPVACDPMAGPVPARLTSNAVPLPPPAMEPCSVARAIEAPCRCRLETATEDGTTHLKVWSGPSTCVTCDQLELKVAGFSGFKVAVADKQVRLHTPMAEAKADRISVTAQEDRILLEGHVRLQYHLDEGEHADVSASRVVVHLDSGRVEIQPSRPEPKATQLMPPADAPPAVFNFFTGIFH